MEVGRTEEEGFRISCVGCEYTNQAVEVSCNLHNVKGKLVAANIITAPKTDTYNTFDKPNEVILKDFKAGSFKNEVLKIKIPEKSVVTVQIK